MSLGLGSLPRDIQNNLIHNLWVLLQKLRPPIRGSKTSWNQRLITEIPETPPGYLITLQTSPQISPIKTVPWKLLGSSGLLSMSHSFHFSTPNFRISVCLTSLSIKHTNLGSMTRKKNKKKIGSAEHWWSRLRFGWKDVLEMRYWGKPLTEGMNERAER